MTSLSRFGNMVARSALLFLALTPPCCALATEAIVKDRVGDQAPGQPAWTDITDLSVAQEGQFLVLTVQTADSIPRLTRDSCSIRFFIDTAGTAAPAAPPAAEHQVSLAEFNLRNWDGSPWYATFFIPPRSGRSGPEMRHRMFDWKLSGNRFRLKFSLATHRWSALRVRAAVYHRYDYADGAPDEGECTLQLDTSAIPALLTKRDRDVVLIYPEPFDTVCSKYDVPRAIRQGFLLQKRLTGIRPVGGDSVRFFFDPYIGGAALEGDPISVGPYMWGDAPLWFVYFHEMGHNFCNASTRFRQLYPLQFSSKPGALPAHLLFYEAFASVPAMFVLERLNEGPGEEALVSMREEWQDVRRRFLDAWKSYKENPAPESLTPDVVDGLLIELCDRYGWEFIERFYALLQPQDMPLPLFDTVLPQDSPDLRITRTTFTSALLSAAAGSTLRDELIRPGWPIDDALFQTAIAELTSLIPIHRRP
jgi:hypothetical protein